MQRGLPPPEDWEPEVQVFALFCGPTGALAAAGLYHWAALYFVGLLVLTIVWMRSYFSDDEW